MQWHSSAHKLIKRYSLIIALIVCAGLLCVLFWLVAQSGTASNSSCVAQANNNIIFFYMPSTSQQQLAAIIASVKGTVTDNYANINGVSIDVPIGSTRTALRLLKLHPEVTRLQLPQAEGCIDTD